MGTNIEANDIVFVLGSKDDYPPRPCLGIVQKVFENNEMFSVRVTPVMVRKNSYIPEDGLLLIGPGAKKLVLAAKGDKEVKPTRNIDKTVLDNSGAIFLTFFTKLMPKRDLPPQFAEIANNTLVAIPADSESQRKCCWGIVKKSMPDGKLDVTLGIRYFALRERAFIDPEKVIPILILEEPGKNVRKIILKNTVKLFLMMFLRLQEMGIFPEQ